MPSPTAPSTIMALDDGIPTVPKPCIVFLNDFPGVGKYAVARELALFLPNAQLLDNHTLVDPVAAIEPGRTPAHFALRKAIRTAAFNGIKEIPCKDLAMILTSCTSTSPADVAVFGEYLDIARYRKVPFVSVNVTCDEQANVARLGADERVRRKGKLINKNVLERLRRNAVPLDPRRDGVDGAGVEMHHFELDNTDLSAQEAAAEIVVFVMRVAPQDEGKS